MSSDKPLRRLPLRTLMANTDRCARELAEQVHGALLGRIADCRDLTRPTRRKSNFPNFPAFQNGMRHLYETFTESDRLIEHLLEHLDAIRDHAIKESTSRKR